MTDTPPPPDAISWWQAGLACRCPRCGKGPVFSGLLKIRDRCPVCDLDLRGHDTGDGPVALIILVLGAIITLLAFWVEFHFNPPFWVHIILWPPITLVLAIAMMRPLKAALVALQYRHRATEMGV